MKLDFTIKLKYESRTIILFVGIRYFMRDLLSDLIMMADPQTSDIRHIPYNVHDVSAPSDISMLYEAVNSITKQSFG